MVGVVNQSYTVVLALEDTAGRGTAQFVIGIMK